MEYFSQISKTKIKLKTKNVFLLCKFNVKFKCYIYIETKNKTKALIYRRKEDKNLHVLTSYFAVRASENYFIIPNITTHITLFFLQMCIYIYNYSIWTLKGQYQITFLYSITFQLTVLFFVWIMDYLTFMCKKCCLIQILKIWNV